MNRSYTDALAVDCRRICLSQNKFEVRGHRVVEEDVGGVGEEHEVLAIRRRGLHRRRQQALAQREDLLELPDHLGVEEASKLFGRYFKTCRLLFYCWCIRVKSY